MSLSGILEADVEVNSPAVLFHEMFSYKPHHLSLVCPGKVKSVCLLKGQMGKEGSVVSCDYVIEGIAFSCKEIIEAVDNANLSTTFKVIEGEPLKEYKIFRTIVKAIPNPRGHGGLVRWTLEYEKLHANVPHRQICLDYVVHLTKEVDTHLLLQQN